MKKMLKYALYLPILIGLLMLPACGDDDDDTVPADPTVTLNATSVDASRGGTATISGTVTTPGGFASLSVDGTAISGLTEGETGDQTFSVTIEIPESAAIGSQIEIDIVATDALQQESPTVTFTINIVSQGAPTIAISGMATADAKRRETVTISLNITAAEGIDELVVTDSDGNAVATVAGADISDPANFTWDYTVPESETVGSDIVLNHNVTDNTGATTNTAAVFTVTVQDFDSPTVSFTDFENEKDTVFNEGSENAISLTVTKDDLVSWQSLTFVKTVNGDNQTPVDIDISDETGSTITYTLTVDETFLDVVELAILLTDEFGNETDRIELSYDVLTSTGEAFLIDPVNVGGNAVQRVRGNITEDVTFMSTNDYWLSGGVKVSEGGMLTIQPGTTIYAESGLDTQLEIEDDGMINAIGSNSNPIIFTSGAALAGGTQAPGDWVGLRFDGDAGVDQGTLSYVRIEYGSTNDAALRLNSVDNSTTLEYIQIYQASDDEPAVEFRGGNAHISNLLVTSANGVSVEFDDDDGVGSLGTMQFVIIESSDFTTKPGRDLEVRDDASPTISNITFIGSGRDAVNSDLSAVRIRDDAGGMAFYNMLIAEYGEDGFRFDPLGADVSLGGDFFFANSYIFRIGDDVTRDDSDPTLPLIFETNAATYSNVIDKDNTPAAAAGIGVADFVPDAEITTNAFDPTTLGAPFVTGTYVGGIGSTDWTLGWTLNPDGSSR